VQQASKLSSAWIIADLWQATLAMGFFVRIATPLGAVLVSGKDSRRRPHPEENRI